MKEINPRKLRYYFAILSHQCVVGHPRPFGYEPASRPCKHARGVLGNGL